MGIPGGARGERLSKRELIKSSSEFREIFEKGKALRGRYLTVFFKTSEERKIGFALKRELRGAVKRNKVKRRLREIYRKEKRRIDPQVEMILLAGKRTETADYDRLREDLLETLDGAGLLKNG